MKINEVKCKTALSRSNLPGLDYSLNPYRGCQHNCAYCYVPNVLRIPRKDWGSFVNVKTNIPILLSKELRNKKPGVIGISTVTDPYQPIEKKYKLTRFCLEQILIHDFPICIQTKSKLILRDLDLIKRFSKAEVIVSIGTLNDTERKLLEPNSSSIHDRLDIFKKISDEGIRTTVFFGPVYPTVKKEDIADIVDTFLENGVKEIMVDKFNYKPGIMKALQKAFPKDKLLIKDTDNFKLIFNEIKRICNKKNMSAITAF